MEITPSRNAKLAMQPLGNQTKAHPPQRDTDTAVFDRAEALKRTLQATPLVRPEVVERARQFIGDAQYPPEEVMQGIAVLLATKLDNATDGAAQNQV